MSEDLISSLYTPPPLFYKYFTPENVQKLEQIEDPSSVEGELKLLIPPPRPPGTHYRGYGNIWSFEDKLPKLSDMGYRQLYEETNDNTNNSQLKIDQLHKLLKSLLVNFLELIGIMTKNPEDFHVKIEDLKVVLININHILNSYRPHQSRELFIVLLKNRIDDKNLQISKIDQTISSIKQNMSGLLNSNELPNVKAANDVEVDGANDNDTRDNINEIKENIVRKLIEDI